MEHSERGANVLSILHEMLAKIGRERHPHRLNRLANDPAIYPHINGYHIGPLDLTGFVKDPRNIALVGEHGALMFHFLQPGIFEVHSMCTLAGRGKWMLRFVQACLHWVFTRTEAIELLTKCPRGHIAALTLARAIKGTYQFTAPRSWVLDRDPVDCDVYGLTLQAWTVGAPGLEERGHWFHEHIEAEYRRLGKTDPVPHPDDATHDRYVGLACEMMLGGQPDKAVVFYNRWASMAGYQPIAIEFRDPLTINIGEAMVVVRENGTFWVPILSGAAEAA